MQCLYCMTYLVSRFIITANIREYRYARLAKEKKLCERYKKAVDCRASPLIPLRFRFRSANMSWVVEQSENTSAVNVNGNTITCRSASGYGSPINVLYKDAADKNGQYFWQMQVNELEGGGGGVSVGVTSDSGFKSGWGLKAMKFLGKRSHRLRPKPIVRLAGNLSDGGCLLVSSFGEHIKQGDTIGVLLQLTDSEMKLYLFQNGQSLGLAFHFQSPYPKPLYPGKTRPPLPIVHTCTDFSDGSRQLQRQWQSDPVTFAADSIVAEPHAPSIPRRRGRLEGGQLLATSQLRRLHHGDPPTGRQ